MQRFNKHYNIALIFITIFLFMLIWILAGGDIVYCATVPALRPPLLFNKENQKMLDLENKLKQQDDEKLFNFLSSAFIEHSLSNVIGGLSGFLERAADKSEIIKAKMLSNFLKYQHEELLENIRGGSKWSIDEILQYIEEIKAIAYSVVQMLPKREDVKKNVKHIEESLRLLDDFKKAFSDLRNLNDVNEIIKVLKEKFRKTGYVIDLCEEDLVFDRKADGEPLSIAGIIDNFIINAHDASKGMAETVVRTSLEKGRIGIRVSDTGPGIAEEVLRRIFEKDFTTKDSKEDGGLGLWLTRIYLGQKGGSIQVDSMTEDGIPRRLIFDKELKEGKILKGDEIPDDSPKRKEMGATFTVTIPEARSYVLRRGAEYTVKFMGQVFKGKRNYVRDSILNMILESLESDGISKEKYEEDIKTLMQFLIAREATYLWLEAKERPGKKGQAVMELLPTSELSKVKPAEKEEEELRIFLDTLGLAWNGSADIIETMDLVGSLRAGTDLTKDNIAQIRARENCNIFSHDLFIREQSAERYLGKAGIELHKEFLHRLQTIEKGFKGAEKIFKALDKEKPGLKLPEKKRFRLFALYEDKLELQVWLFDQFINIGKTEYGIPEETLLGFSCFDPSGHIARKYGLKKMPDIRHLLLMARGEFGPNVTIPDMIKFRALSSSVTGTGL